MTSPARVEIARDGNDLARVGAEWFTASLERSTGMVAVALSGGSTPKALYRLLAEAPFRDRLPWARVHWFLGDERFVPFDHPDSNGRMITDALFSRVAIPGGHIHLVPTTAPSADEAARLYEAELRAFHGSGELGTDRPLLALNLLGIGPDGHTASLFPGTAALDEGVRWVVANTKEAGHERVTLTFPALDSTAEAAFLAGGEGKRAIVSAIRDGRETGPAAHMAALLGSRLTWLLDRDSAAG